MSPTPSLLFPHRFEVKFHDCRCRKHGHNFETVHDNSRRNLWTFVSFTHNCESFLRKFGNLCQYCTVLDTDDCPGFRELSLRLSRIADWLPFDRVTYCLHYTVKFQKWTWILFSNKSKHLNSLLFTAIQIFGQCKQRDTTWVNYIYICSKESMKYPQ